jgi:hypothetical protein
MTELAFSSSDDFAVLASIRMRAGTLAVRDALPSDVDAFLKYWHYSGDKIINFLRIDRAKLGTPEDTRQRFFSMIRNPEMVDQPSVVFTLTLNGEVIGYTNVNRRGPDDNYPHFHTYLHTHRDTVRSAVKTPKGRDGARTGAGIAAALIGPVIGVFFEHFPMRRIVLQTRVTSVGINRTLDRYLPPDETKFIEVPDGIASTGEFHMRYVYRKDVPWMIERAHVLANGA